MQFCSTPNWGLWNTSALHNCLACLFCPHTRHLLHHYSFSRHQCSQKEQGWGRSVRWAASPDSARGLARQGPADKSVQTETQFNIVCGLFFFQWDGGLYQDYVDHSWRIWRCLLLLHTYVSGFRLACFRQGFLALKNHPSICPKPRNFDRNRFLASTPWH